MTWRRWLAGLCAALVGSLGTIAGCAVGAYQLGYDVADISFWQIIGGGVAFNALTALGLHIKQFPPPGALTLQEPLSGIRRSSRSVQ